MKTKTLLIGMILAILLTACGAPAATWEERYEYGMKCLSEGSYSEAILAFTAAIEIDPNNPLAYVGRGNAYVEEKETAENLSAAQADFEKAITLDGTNVDAYLGLADVYIRRGEFDKAQELLHEALERTGDDQKIADKLAEMESGTINDSSGKTRKSVHIEDGMIKQYWLYEYDERGNNIKTTCYDGDGTLKSTEISEFNENNQEIRAVTTGQNKIRTEEYTYDAQGRRIKEVWTSSDDSGNNTRFVTDITYDDEKRTETHAKRNEDGNLVNRFVIEHDENGVRTKGFSYVERENGEVLDYYVVYIWNEDGSYGGYELFQVNKD